MKIKYIVLFVLLIGLHSLSLSAQNKKAIQILEEVSTQTKSYKNIKVSFAYIMENKEADIYEQTQGTLVLSGDKYHLSVAGQEIICDGQSIWTFFPDINEVQINNVSEDESFTPQKMLSNYTEDFIPKREKDVRLSLRSAYSIKLKPKDEESMVKNAVLLIDKKSKQLLSFIFYDFEGNSFTYNIKDFITNAILANDIFLFNMAKHPDVEVIDMR